MMNEGETSDVVRLLDWLLKPDTDVQKVYRNTALGILELKNKASSPDRQLDLARI